MVPGLQKYKYIFDKQLKLWYVQGHKSEKSMFCPDFSETIR